MDTYVYGVLRAGAGKRPSAEGVEGRPVERVVDGELAAIVSNAPSVPVRANRRNLLAHSEVLAGEIGDHCVLPMQFGVVMPSREAVAAELLQAHAAWLAEQLEALDPYVQLSVRALCPEEALLRSVVAERPEIASLRASLEDQS